MIYTLPVTVGTSRILVRDKLNACHSAGGINVSRRNKRKNKDIREKERKTYQQTRRSAVKQNTHARYIHGTYIIKWARLIMSLSKVCTVEYPSVACNAQTTKLHHARIAEIVNVGGYPAAVIELEQVVRGLVIAVDEYLTGWE